MMLAAIHMCRQAAIAVFSSKRCRVVSSSMRMQCMDMRSCATVVRRGGNERLSLGSGFISDSDDPRTTDVAVLAYLDYCTVA